MLIAMGLMYGRQIGRSRCSCIIWVWGSLDIGYLNFGHFWCMQVSQPLCVWELSYHGSHVDGVGPLCGICLGPLRKQRCLRIFEVNYHLNLEDLSSHLVPLYRGALYCEVPVGQLGPQSRLLLLFASSLDASSSSSSRSSLRLSSLPGRRDLCCLVRSTSLTCSRVCDFATGSFVF